MDKNINEMTIGEAKEAIREYKTKYDELCALFNKESDLSSIEFRSSKEIDHGCCIVVLDKGFMYIGNLTTDGEFLTINKPKNIRRYTSGKGLLWHAKNGSKDMILDPYDGIIKAPYSELKHFIPTDKKLWV